MNVMIKIFYIKNIFSFGMHVFTLFVLGLTFIVGIILSFAPSATGQEKYCFGAEIFDVALVESPSSSGVSIIGSLFNNSSSPSFTEMKIVAELYDETGRLVGVESTYPEVEGMFSPFKIQTSVSNATLDHFVLRC